MRFQSYRSYRLRRVIAISALLVAAPMAIASDQEFSRVRLGEQIQRLTAEGFRNLGDQSIERLPKDEPLVVELELVAGRTYAFVGTCGETCSHVELRLTKGASEVVAKSTDTATVAVLAGEPPGTGDYKLLLTTPLCNKDSGCAVSFAVLERSPPVVPETATAPTPPADAAATTPPLSETQSSRQPTAPNSPPMSGEMPAATPPQPEPANQLTELVVLQLKSLIMTQIEIDRARKAEPPALVPATATELSTAPGKAKGVAASNAPQAPPPPPQQSAPQRPAASANSGANCQAMYQRYYAAAQAAGSPELIGPLQQMYQRFRTQCPNFRP